VFKTPLQRSKDFRGHKLHKAAMPCKHTGHQYMIEFEVIDYLAFPASAFNTADTKDLSTKVFDHYNDVFDGLGSISDVL